jgi:hypothetical protein
VLVLLAFDAGAAEGRLSIESGPGFAGPVAWQLARLSLSPGASGGPPDWQARVEGFEAAGLQGDLVVECAAGGLREGRPWCGEGRFEWRQGGPEPVLSGQLFQPDADGSFGLRLAEGALELVIEWPADDGALTAEARLDAFALSELPEALIRRAGLSVLEGRVDGRLQWRDGRLSGELGPAGLSLDRPDGLLAAAGVAASIELQLGPAGADGAWPFAVSLAQGEGELLAGPVYLPPPEAPLTIAASGSYRPGDGLDVDAFTLDDGGLLALAGELSLLSGPDAWALESLRLDSLDVQLPGAWTRWGEGPAGAFGLGGLETAGRIEGELLWEQGALASLRLGLDELVVSDARDRFAFEGIDGQVVRDGAEGRIALDWSALELFRLGFGPSSLRAEGEAGRWRLREPLALPLLDGAVIFDRLELDESGEGAPAVALDARIEPLDLSELTRMLGLPEFGGSLSGRFPGVELEGERLAFTGGIDVNAFDGRIALTDLVIERPFGSLPALAAQVEFDRLDLEALTGAFNFGHMEGEMSGWMRDLRLLDWQPVAMDARVFTHDDAPSRRIGQRAVENLSRLGGGAAALSAPLLGLFEEFPYRRAGLACRLDRNICHMDGVAPREGGGFYIVEGRGLPRLDVIGHRRLVDWPRVVAQLAAIARQE